MCHNDNMVCHVVILRWYSIQLHICCKRMKLPGDQILTVFLGIPLYMHSLACRLKIWTESKGQLQHNYSHPKILMQISWVGVTSREGIVYLRYLLIAHIPSKYNDILNPVEQLCGKTWESVKHVCVHDGCKKLYSSM